MARNHEDIEIIARHAKRLDYPPYRNEQAEALFQVVGIRCLPMTRLFILCLICAATCSAAVFNVKDFGAKGDGKTQERDSINKAIEAAAAAGGGTVPIFLQASIFQQAPSACAVMSRSIWNAGPPSKPLRKAGSTMWPSPTLSINIRMPGIRVIFNSLIWGENLDNIAITGGGLISGKALSANAAPPAIRCSR